MTETCPPCATCGRSHREIADGHKARNGLVGGMAAVAELRALVKLALVIALADDQKQERAPIYKEEWATWAHMTETKLRELGLR